MRAKHQWTNAAAGEAIAALETLVVEDLPLKERLIEAWTSYLSKLHGVELPPHFQKRFDAMLEGASRDELILDWIGALSADEARMLACRMFHFALDIQMVVGAEKR